MRVAATLTQQHSDDIKVVTHEVKDCKAKLDSFRTYDDAMLLIVHVHLHSRTGQRSFF